MVAVRMVQVIANQVVEMIAVRHHFMPASGAVTMLTIVTAAGMLRGAAVRIPRVHRNHMFNDAAIRLLMMQVAVVQEIDMAVMLDRGVAAAGSMLVIVVRV